MDPDRPRRRSRSPLPLPVPRDFIPGTSELSPVVFGIKCHATTIVKIGKFSMKNFKVQTFTTAEPGKPFMYELCDPKKQEMCDPIHQNVMHAIQELVSKKKEWVPSKDSKEIIYEALCAKRSECFMRDVCRFKHHAIGEEYAEIGLFGDGAVITDLGGPGIFMMNYLTGEIICVNAFFGLERKEPIPYRHPDTRALEPFAKSVIETALKKQEETLKQLQEQMKQPDIAEEVHLKTKKQIDALKMQMHAIERRFIPGICETSRLGYNEYYEAKYGKQIKYSDLCEIGIENGILTPNDSVIIFGCSLYESMPDVECKEVGSPRRGGRRRRVTKPKCRSKCRSKSKSKCRSKSNNK
jgi:hypothetical protein